MKKPIKTLIVVKGQFEAIHSWDKCPHKDVSFLKWPHRHIFHVVLKLIVTHDDRDLEFIKIKRILEDHLIYKYHRYDLGSKSCEMLAEEIGDYFNRLIENKVAFVSVSEDEENSAEIYYE